MRGIVLVQQLFDRIRAQIRDVRFDQVHVPPPAPLPINQNTAQNAPGAQARAPRVRRVAHVPQWINQGNIIQGRMRTRLN